MYEFTYIFKIINIQYLYVIGICKEYKGTIIEDYKYQKILILGIDNFDFGIYHCSCDLMG